MTSAMYLTLLVALVRVAPSTKVLDEKLGQRRSVIITATTRRQNFFASFYSNLIIRSIRTTSLSFSVNEP